MGLFSFLHYVLNYKFRILIVPTGVFQFIGQTEGQYQETTNQLPPTGHMITNRTTSINYPQNQHGNEREAEQLAM